jgi:hypothetical protein
MALHQSTGCIDALPYSPTSRSSGEEIVAARRQCQYNRQQEQAYNGLDDAKSHIEAVTALGS